jgi:hypothetical protein
VRQAGDSPVVEVVDIDEDTIELDHSGEEGGVRTGGHIHIKGRGIFVTEVERSEFFHLGRYFIVVGDFEDDIELRFIWLFDIGSTQAHDKRARNIQVQKLYRRRGRHSAHLNNS